MSYKITQMDINMAKKAQFDDEDVDCNQSHSPTALVGLPSEKILNDMKKFEEKGLFSTSCSYYGLMNPICKYALTKIINDGPKPVYLTGGGYSSGPVSGEIQVDVDKTETVYQGIDAIYPDKIITASESYGEFSVLCYARSKKESKSYINELKRTMEKENQYRGKFLFFGDGNIEFREESDVNFDDVIISDENKKEIILNTLSFLTRDELRKLGMNQRGLILHGPPGTGKTMLVKSLFSSLVGKGITRLYATADTFRSPSDMTELFNFLKYCGSTALALEDMDLISPDRKESGEGRKILGSLLNNLNGLKTVKEPFVIVGTTNDIASMDAALANRPCRFDRKIEIALPKASEIKQFYKKLSGIDASDDLVVMSEGFSGAHIQEVINTAKLLSVENSQEVNDCLVSACGIIKDNFFPMMKEAVKNKEMTKAAQQYMLLFPSDGERVNMDDLESILPFLQSKINFSKNEISDKEATALWNSWKSQASDIEDNKLSITRGNSDMEHIKKLKDKGYVDSLNDDFFSLSENKGKKLMRQLILTQEVSPYDSKAIEKESVDVLEMKQKIMGASSKKMKAANSAESVPTERVSINDNDYYYNTIKGL